MAAHLRAGLLRRRDDAHCRPQIRHGQVCPCLAMLSVILLFPALWIGIVLFSVGDLDPQDPHVFGPPGSGSGPGSFPFLKQCLENRI